MDRRRAGSRPSAACADLGFASITVPCAVGDRNPDDPENFPLYELAEDLDVPLGFHAGGGRFAHDRFVDSYAQLHALEFPFNIMFAATTIVCGGVLERFPPPAGRAARGGHRLGAVPPRALDEHWERRPRGVPRASPRPRARTSPRAACSSRPRARRASRRPSSSSGDHWIVWASDYPHWDSAFPDSVTHVTDRADISDEAKAAIFDANPRRLYGW